MQKLNLPEFDFNIRKRENGFEIFDYLRKKYVILSPEEWVRQNLLAYLIRHKNIPEGYIQVEGSIQLGKLKKRCDIIVYNKNHCPVLLVECKEPKTSISQKTFDQICRYNITLQVPYLLISNGIEHYCFSINTKNHEYNFLDYIPDWDEINVS